MNHFFLPSWGPWDSYGLVRTYRTPFGYEMLGIYILLRSGFRGNLFCFSHGRRCTDCDVLISLSYALWK